MSTEYKLNTLFIPHPRKVYKWIKTFRSQSCFDPSVVREILSKYQLDLIGSIKPVAEGMRNENLIINTTKGLKFLKIYKNSLGDTTITQEHSILTYLFQTGFSSVPLETTSDGLTIVRFNQRRFALYDFIKGFHIYDYLFSNTNLKHLIFQAGYILGKLHNQLRNFTPEGFNPDGFNLETGRRWRGIEWFDQHLAYIKSCGHNANLREQENALELLDSEIVSFRTDLVKTESVLTNANLPKQVVHVDFGRSNVLFHKNELPTIIDFEIARIDWKIVDILNGLTAFCVKNRKLVDERVKIFLQAYNENSCLTEKELHFMPILNTYLNISRCIKKLRNYCVNNDNIPPEKMVQHLYTLRNDQLVFPDLKIFSF